MNKPIIITLTGPSGAGKSFTLEALCSKFGFNTIVSFTTRAPRAGEIDGVAYHFVSRDQAERLIKKDLVAEHVHLNGNIYGITKQELLSKTKDRHAIVIVDPPGVLSISHLAAELSLIHLPIWVDTSDEVREKRLVQRGVEQLAAGRAAEPVLSELVQRLRAFQAESSWKSKVRWIAEIDGTSKDYEQCAFVNDFITLAASAAFT